jgi:hypothetical protein
MWQRLKCYYGWGIHHFWHKPIVVIDTMKPTTTDIVKCKSCGKLFGMNHNVKSILPLDDEMIKMYRLFGNKMEYLE